METMKIIINKLGAQGKETSMLIAIIILITTAITIPAG